VTRVADKVTWLSMSEKTEDATPKKLREARKKGEVPKSRELGTAAVVLAVGGALVATGDGALGSLRQMLRGTLRTIEGGGPFRPGAVLEMGMSFGLDAVLPVLVAGMLAGTLASFLQVGPMLTLAPVAPKPERLDPIKGLKNLFNQKQLVELLKTLLKLGIIGWVAWMVLESSVRGIAGLAGRDASATVSGTAGMVSRMLFRAGGAIGAIAILDVFYQRWRYAQDQKMSKDEVKREHKEAEGDPHAKQHRDRLHREIIEHDTVEQVRGADVLVVNPTHLAIALRYDEAETDAPEVVAKGSEHLARRMIEAARESGVPVMRDVPLARALFELELGEQIPEALYEAVAAVLKAAWAETEENP